MGRAYGQIGIEGVSEMRKSGQKIEWDKRGGHISGVDGEIQRWERNYGRVSVWMRTDGPTELDVGTLRRHGGV